MVYLQKTHLIADSLFELHAFAKRLGLKRGWFKDEDYPHYDVFGSRVEMAQNWGAIEISAFSFKRIGEMLMRQMLPDNLYKGGFSPYEGLLIDLEKVKILRANYIKKEWMPGKRLNKHYSSSKLAAHASEILQWEVSNGELIAAAILEKYRHEASQPNALFYLDIKL